MATLSFIFHLWMSNYAVHVTLYAVNKHCLLSSLILSAQVKDSAEFFAHREKMLA